MTLKIEMDLSPALFLYADSDLTAHMTHRNYYMYVIDVYDATQLRIIDRETFINWFSLEQLQDVKHYLETIIPMRMMKNV